jgi:hypothetical protein
MIKIILLFLVKQGVFNNLYKIILVHLHKRMIMNQFHIHSLGNFFYHLSINQLDMIFIITHNE